MTRVCQLAVWQLGLSGAAVTMMATGGAEAIAAVSDEAFRPIEQLQFSLGEGPGREAFDTGRPVLTGDMQGAAGRWPGYSPAAVRAGVGAAYAFPLQLGASRFGVLTFYASASRTLSHEDAAACLALAAYVTDALLDGDGGVTASLDPTLSSALRYRSEVFQAQGLVMIDLGVSLVDALARLRAHAYGNGMELDQLAIEVISGDTRLEADNG